MKTKKFLLFLLFFPIFSFAFTIKVPTSIVSLGISKNFPIEQEKLGNKIRITDPILTIENNKFKLQTNYTLHTLIKDFSGIMIFESDIKYNPETSDIYLDKLKLIKLTDKDKTFAPTEKFDSDVLVQALYKLAESKSIYNTKEHKLINLLTIKNIFIENDGLRIEL